MNQVDVALVVYGWTPPDVARIAASLRAHAQNDEEIELLKRLLYDPQMRTVWQTLLSENRKAGEFLYPAVGGVLNLHGPVVAQNRAMGEVLNLAFCAARDRIAVRKLPEVEAFRAKLLEEAAPFRAMADKLAAAGVATPEANSDAAAALRMAQIKEEEVSRILAYLCNSNDPLVIRNERGDRVVRGVQIEIAEGLKRIFGKPLYGTATTLAEVALDKQASSRAVRSAITRK
jgi:hypothetical protein